MENNEDIFEFDELANKVDTLTSKQVNDVFNKYLSLDKLVMIYIGNFEKKE